MSEDAKTPIGRLRALAETLRDMSDDEDPILDSTADEIDAIEAELRLAGAPYPRLWVNAERTVLFRVWGSGVAEIAKRDHRSHTWGPPIAMLEETTS